MHRGGFHEGDRMSVTTYRGPSKVEADATYKFLMDRYNDKKPMPLGGSTFSIIVKAVKRTEIEDPLNMNGALDGILYEIKFKGELLCEKLVK